jgi:hypothetical protein
MSSTSRRKPEMKVNMELLSGFTWLGMGHVVGTSRMVICCTVSYEMRIILKNLYTVILLRETLLHGITFHIFK